MTGEELKDWRKRQGLTQAQLAKQLGIALRTLIYWETDGPTQPTMLELACKQLEHQ